MRKQWYQQLIIFSLCSLFFISACQYKKMKNTGLLLLKGGRYYDAVYYFGKAVKEKPSYAEGYYLRGLAYCGLQKFSKALADFDQAVTLDDQLTAAYINRGIIKATRKQLDTALADFNKALSLDDENSQAYTNRAGLYYLQGKYDQALADFDRAISLDPTNIANYLNRGDIYQRQGNLEAALADFKKAGKQKKKSPKSNLQLARLMLQLHEYQEAAGYAKKVIDLYPRQAEGYALAGEAFYYQGRVNKAALDFSRALGYEPTLVQQRYPRVYYLRGKIYYQQQRFSFAKEDFKHYLLYGKQADLKAEVEQLLAGGS